jgi:ribose transport system permease protein
VPVSLAVAACLLTGCTAGLLNGALIGGLRIVPFIVTLGTMTLYLGVAKLVAGETTIRPALDRVPPWIPALVKPRPNPAWLVVPWGVWIVLALTLVMESVMRLTVFGRHVVAVGMNEQAARLCGIRVGAVKVAVYSIAGLFVGVAGLLQFARLSSGNPTAGIGVELRVIAAVVVGGGSLSGGRGSMVGTFLGACVMTVIASGCTMLELKNPVQDIVIGVIVVAVVVLDQMRRRR